MDIQSVKKLTMTVNSVLLFMVLALMTFFKMCGAVFLTYFSIPTIIVYVIGYFLIFKDKLYGYVCMVFSWITLYMCVTTLCLGNEYGFHLYCFSVIPIVFATKYIGHVINSKQIKALHICLGIAVFYLACTGYVSNFGAVYDISHKYASVFWIVNALSVLGFLIYYINYLMNSIIKSENMLKDVAHKDRLTGLYNRHYMVEYLDSLPCNETAGSLAMADIDDFKNINDVYGHSAGDLVLKTVSDKLRDICSGSVVARWGGEEFLILIPQGEQDIAALIDRARQDISSKAVRYEEHDITVTITVGSSQRQAGQSIDEWIKNVDEKLYVGKNSGKNKVVI